MFTSRSWQRQLLAVLLAMVMVVSLLPAAAAFADDDTDPTEPTGEITPTDVPETGDDPTEPTEGDDPAEEPEKDPEGTLTVTVNFKIYEAASEDGGGTHASNNLVDKKSTTIKVAPGNDRSFVVPLEADWGITHTSGPDGITKTATYTADGNQKFLVADTYTKDTATVEMNICKSWTNRIAQFQYTSDDGMSFSYHSMQIAAAPSDAPIATANNYANTDLLGMKGVRANAPEGYHYSGRAFFALATSPNNYTYMDPSSYGLSMDKATGELSGTARKLTGDEQLCVLYYYVKDGQDLKGTFYRYYFFDGTYDAAGTTVDNPIVESTVDVTPPYFYGYKFDHRTVSTYEEGYWHSDTVTWRGDNAVMQIDGTMGANFYYVTADKYAVSYVSNEKGDGQGSSYDGGKEFEQATYTVLGNDTTAFKNEGYTFTGWNTKADGSGDAYAAGETFTMPAADVTLYAQWRLDLKVEATGYTGDYDGQEHAISAKANQEATLSYSTDEGKTWSETVPASTDVTKQTVLVKAANDFEEVIASPVVLEIKPLTLTVTAEDASRKVGEKNPEFKGKIEGFIEGEDESVLTGKPAYTTTADEKSPVGKYPITAAQGTLAAKNYEFKFVPGTLTVTAKPAGGGSTAPKTGDSSNLALWGAMLAVSALGVVVVTTCKKQKGYTK